MVQRANQQAEPATVVIDNGTGYTKMGYAGNMEPSYLIPSCIAKAVPRVSIFAIYSIRIKIISREIPPNKTRQISDILTYTPFSYVFSKVESIEI